MKQVKPKKSLGQHFLKDSKVSKKIVDSLISKKLNTIIEIGPGMGALTNVLNQDGISIKAIDIDKNNIDYLSKHFKGPAKFEFFQGDILSIPLNFLIVSVVLINISIYNSINEHEWI